MTDKKVVIIDRATWRNGSQDGEKFGGTCLENRQGFSCCLGFVCRAEGHKTITERTFLYPRSLRVQIPGLTSYDGNPYNSYDDTDLALWAAKINDDQTITKGQREYRLRKLFREHPESRWILSFRGKYPVEPVADKG